MWGRGRVEPPRGVGPRGSAPSCSGSAAAMMSAVRRGARTILRVAGLSCSGVPLRYVVTMRTGRWNSLLHSRASLVSKRIKPLAQMVVLRRLPPHVKDARHTSCFQIEARGVGLAVQRQAQRFGAIKRCRGQQRGPACASEPGGDAGAPLDAGSQHWAAQRRAGSAKPPSRVQHDTTPWRRRTSSSTAFH